MTSRALPPLSLDHHCSLAADLPLSEIASFIQPLAEWTADLGSTKSPLIFDDGRGFAQQSTGCAGYKTDVVAIEARFVIEDSRRHFNSERSRGSTRIEIVHGL